MKVSAAASGWDSHPLFGHEQVQSVRTWRGVPIEHIFHEEVVGDDVSKTHDDGSH